MYLAFKLIFALFNGQYVCVVCQAGIVLAAWLQRLMAGRRRLSLNEIYTCREAGQLSSSVVDTALNFTPATSATSNLHPRPSSPLPTTSINAQQTATRYHHKRRIGLNLESLLMLKVHINVAKM